MLFIDLAEVNTNYKIIIYSSKHINFALIINIINVSYNKIIFDVDFIITNVHINT